MDIATSRRQRVKSKQEFERARILSVTTDLFYERGYQGTTVETISSALGMQKPFIYWYFDSKEDILSVLCFRSVFAARSTLVPDSPGQDMLHALYESCRRFALTSILDYKVGSLILVAATALSSSARSRITKTGRDYAEGLERLLVRAKRQKIVSCRDCAVTARLMSGIPVFIYRWYEPNGKLSPQDLAHEVACAMVGAAGGPSCDHLKPRRARSYRLNLKDEPWAKEYGWLVETPALDPGAASLEARE